MRVVGTGSRILGDDGPEETGIGLHKDTCFKARRHASANTTGVTGPSRTVPDVGGHTKLYSTFDILSSDFTEMCIN